MSIHIRNVYGPIVYRLGRQVLILASGVRLSVGSQKIPDSLDNFIWVSFGGVMTFAVNDTQPRLIRTISFLMHKYYSNADTQSISYCNFTQYSVADITILVKTVHSQEEGI